MMVNSAAPAFPKTEPLSSEREASGEIRGRALKHGPEALERLLLLMRSENERIALAACQEMLNRAYGRPEPSHKFEGELDQTVVVVRTGESHG
ncbi:MAG: hypothetical protein LBP33_01260 [Candidatus Adiutrix sp.]|nr:hypothetical protein [Candidatus Adiutrix sp.]